MIRGIEYRLGIARERAAYALSGAASFLRRRYGSPDQDVSAVLVGRNDDYMRDFASRLRITIAWNLRHFAGEVVFVEWNPPSDRELLSLALAKEFPELKAYVVPERIHREFCQNPNLALMEYHAKNVGLRRATRRWVLATNADVAIGLDTARRLSGELSAIDCAWTAERVDIPWREWRQRPLGLVDVVRFKRRIPYHQLGTGDFVLASRELWERIGGYDEGLKRHRIGCDIRGTAQMLAHGATIRRAGTVLHLEHPTSCTEGVREHHGEPATSEGVPYENGPSWGLADRREIEIAERVWRIE